MKTKTILRNNPASKSLRGFISYAQGLKQSKIASAYRRFLENKPVGLRKEIIPIRKQLTKLLKEREQAIRKVVVETSKKYPQFRAVMFFGSTSRWKEKPNDIDVIVFLDRGIDRTIKKNVINFLENKIEDYTDIKLHTCHVLDELYPLSDKPKWGFNERFLFGDEEGIAQIRRWWQGPPLGKK